MKAHNLTKKFEVHIVDALTTFISKFQLLDEAPPVTHICIQGGELYYQGIPNEGTSETLRFFYLRKPDVLEEDEDEPTCIPVFLHEDLIVNYVCAACFNLIEEGIDGAKINFNKYMTLYQEAQVKLQQFLPVAPESPDYIPTEEEPYILNV
jgi:hypothetical protein